MDGKGECAGGLLSNFWKARIIEFYGPHVFYPERETEIGAMLLEVCLAKAARTKALGLVSLTGVPPALEGHFEYLGKMKDYSSTGEAVDRPCFYRLLHEDPGCHVFTDAILKDYLQGEYDRLFLARELRAVVDQGETKSGASIFAADIHRERSAAIMRPLWPGADLDANMGRHYRFCREEGIDNIFFALDLGISWHASLMRDLTRNNFRPAMIVPYAGHADLMVFQHERAES
jgi:hypothetical protein